MTHPEFMPRVRSGALTGFQQLCNRLHINPINLLASENLTSSVLRSTELMISYDSLAHVLNLAADTADYPLFGAEMSTYQGLKIFGPLGLLAAESETIAEALEVIQKYFHFHAQGVILNVAADKRDATIAIKIQIDPSISQEQLLEMSLLLGYEVMCEMSPDIAASTKVHFRHSPLAPIEQYNKITSARLCFDQETDAIIFPACILGQKPRPASADVKSYLETFLDRESKGHEQPLTVKVSKLIYELMPTGEATLATIAPILGLNLRTLQRELRLAGTEFRTLLDEVRFEIAREALDKNYSITDVALNLGYSELSAFSRAFKRWAGVTPQQWRQTTHQSVA